MKTKNSKNTLSRRDFLKSSAVGALGAVIARFTDHYRMLLFR
ncbi:MAG: twin-arginine translocation signal domain-containing protein [Alistipes indistinctus]